MQEMLGVIVEGLDKMRGKKPLIHHLTNHVVMSDCANITLHAGGAPVMTMAEEEVEEMVSMADGLVLNIGTLTSSYVDIMIKAGRKANEQRVPVLFDPVGAGATAMRTEAARRIMDEVNVDVVKGNAGEMSVLCGIEARVRGVDSAGSSEEPEGIAAAFARRYGTTAVVTGEIDCVSSGGKSWRVKNGHVMLSRLVGTGCMLGSVISCFLSVMDDPAEAAVAGLVTFGAAAELAGDTVSCPGSFKPVFFDSIYSIDSETIIRLAAVEEDC